ncbi:MAG: hypothetical protein AAB532_03145, partial [Patescibacteria group bacterium]
MKKLLPQNVLKFKKIVKPIFIFLKAKIKPQYKRFMLFAKKKPITAFIILLGVLLFLIVLSNLISRPVKEDEDVKLPVKEVSIYTIGSSPKIRVQAQVEKSGVIKIVSLGNGVVQNINVFVGQEVYRGTNIVSLSTNYQGGNAF